MSLVSLQQAFDLIDRYTEELDVLLNGPCSEETVTNAEKALNINFSNTYRTFLIEKGSGGVGGDYIYGLGKSDSNFVGQMPSVTAYHVVWTNLYDRQHYSHPCHLITIYEVVDGTTYCLDTSQMNEEGECPVVVWPIGGYEQTPVLEIIAKDFGELFLNMLKEEIADKNLEEE